ncbi:MAG: YraN family protein [Rhodospirillaceae bacterium]|jgi:putative endonuclease|nr:YraN family protein [Rhodospirillaceae bacterium]MBT5373626.1 YraN family protein [Rhodospirillaceae bacterium]MBT5658958.1 YraN family protein [Rhodospirillaceae bacterium]MBT5753153.1 YraN family protein [Rhodospirillaceae bacterium]
MAGLRTDRGRDAWAKGRGAEKLSRLWLRLKGYRILEKNWRCSSGEIDIIARRGRVLAFIEVKARSNYETAANAITQRQRQRVFNAAKAFLAANPDLCSCDLRFDAILVTPKHPPHHICDAWREGWS